AGFWRVCRRVECRQELWKCLTDTARGQRTAIGALGRLPWQVHVLNGPPRQAELGVSQGDEPCPAIGLLRSPHPRGGPVERLLAEPVGVLQIKAVDVRSPDHRQVRLAWSTPPQPQALGDARLTRQALDLDQHQGAAHDRFRAVATFGWMVLGFGVHAGPGAHPDQAILRVLLAVLVGRRLPGALLGAGELLLVSPWPPHLRTDRWSWI